MNPTPTKALKKRRMNPNPTIKINEEGKYE